MDQVTEFISSLNYPLLTKASTFINDDLGFIVVLAILLMFLEPRREKRIKVIFVLILAMLFSVALKEIIQIPRPCVSLPGKIPCPTDYAFPSTHASIAFALMLAFINKPTYPIFVLFAIFVAFSRVYLGVHTVDDVLAGLVVAPIAYQTVEILWKHKK